MLSVNDFQTYNGEKAVLKQSDGQRIRVCSFNVGNFCHGASGEAQGTDEMYSQFIDAFRDCAADVYLFSEWDIYWNQSAQTNSVDVLGNFMQYHSPDELVVGTSTYIGQMIYSAFPHISDTKVMFGDGQSRCFIDSVMRINGKNVHFMSTHLPYNLATLRRSDIQKIFDYINENQIEYYVFGGDFNLGLDSDGSQPSSEAERLAIARADVDFIESLGGVSVQGSYWGSRLTDGFIDTVTRGKPVGYGCQALSDVVVSPNMIFRNVGVVITPASDHDALIVDLEIVG